MTAPKTSVIAQVLLLSHGFVTAQELSQKLVVFYKLAEDLFGSAEHDWGLRTLRAVLEFVAARRLLAMQKGVKVDETVALCNALEQYNKARMSTVVEREQFADLFKQVFGAEAVEADREEEEDADGVYMEHIVGAAEELGLQASEDFCEDVESLGELLALRRTVLLIGSPGSGKSPRWQTL
jgi:hypothetical protein